MSPRLLVIVNKSSKFDISSAELYGKPVHVDGFSELAPFKTDQLIDMLDEFVEQMDFDPDNDMFVMTGNSIHVAIAFGYLIARFGEVKTLLFDATKHSYVLRRVSMPADLVSEEESK